MSDFLSAIRLEYQRQKSLKRWCKEKLMKVPEGFISVRTRKRRTSYYWNVCRKKDGKAEWHQISIKDNPHLQLQLLEKKLNREKQRRVTKNLKLLKKIEKGYVPTDTRDIEETIAPQFKDLMVELRKQQTQDYLNAPYSHCPFNPEFHKHDTDCGIMVRSKSEKIIVNTLVAYGIPFHYEQEFEYAGSRHRKIYPDFTIFLPNGKVIIWEHLGLLSHEDYCIENARKLNIYQQCGFTIGENLILTMDNNKGDLSSALINRIIKNDILPYFQ